MKKEVLRALTMLSLVATLTAVGGIAQAQTFNAIRVDVPFDFNDGARVFPAGKYTIRPIGANGTNGISITSDHGNASEFRICLSAETTSPKSETALVFNRYGDHYFLSQIWTAGETTGLQFPKTPVERRFERAIETSKGGSAAAAGPEIVTVAAALPTSQR
jgi:hypothetical protein